MTAPLAKRLHCVPSNLEEACQTMEEASSEIGTLKARIEELEEVLQFIADGYDNHDVNHVDYRVKVYQVALDVLQPKAGS